MASPDYNSRTNMRTWYMLARERWYVGVMVLIGLLFLKLQFWASQDSELRIACVGDSITYGNGSHLDPPIIPKNGPDRGNYPMMLQEALSGLVKRKMGVELKVGNFGLRGATAMKPYDSQWGGDRAQLSYWTSAEFAAAKAFSPHLVILMLGTNDSKLKKWDEQAREQFTADYHGLIAQLSKPKNPSLVKMWLAYPPTAHTHLFDIDDNELQSVVRPLVERIAFDLGLGTIDMRAALAAETAEGESVHSFCMDGEGKLKGDGVHPCARGTARMAAAAAKAVRDWINGSSK
eukprot:comp17534_c0_seq1/m.17085 comp17534_c0_seq1/g.17085  ORF comp17534_c0_seq1/g.17085 comp17534_c0_seq1/m.17085 type:complete len:290 (-) comp17534_c0_seq1:293-1162(-)